MIDQMNGPALVRAYNGLAALRNIDGVKRFSDAKTGRLRVQASLEIVQESHEVTLAEDGEVTSTSRAGLASGTTTQPSPSLPASPAADRVSPGLARLRANLGDAGTEALRQQVLSDGDKSLVVAAKREDELPPHSRDAKPSDTPVASAPDITHVTRREPAAGFSAPGAAQAFADSYALKKVEPSAEVAQTEVPAQPAAEAAKPAAPAPTATARPAGQQRKSTGRAPAVSDTDVILVQFADGYNPKRLVAAERFAKYKHKMAVAEYVAAIGNDKKQALRDIAWDSSKGWIKVVGASQVK